MYGNQEYCQISKVWNDLKTFCPNGDCLSDQVIIKNAKKNVMQLGGKLYELFNILIEAEMYTDEEVLNAVDKLGETYGSIVSYLLGFDQRFNGEEHAHRKLSIPQVKLPQLPEMPKIKFPKLPFWWINYRK